MAKITVINLEKDHPSTDDALKKLRVELSLMKRLGVHKIKIIHGYGSSGTGGSIRIKSRQYLHKLEREGFISCFCPGESFGPFEADGRKIVSLASDFRADKDWARHNEGITMILI